jgi:hypothetical protein
MLRGFELELDAETFVIGGTGDLVPHALGDALQAGRVPNFVVRFPRRPT